jgi:hypothetical protein
MCVYVGPLGIRITHACMHAVCVFWSAYMWRREWFLSVWLSFFGSSSYFHFDSEIFITSKRAFVEAIKSARRERDRELEKRVVYFCGAAASKFQSIYFHAKVEAMCHAWTRKSINAHRTSNTTYHIYHIYTLCILYIFLCVCYTCMRSQQRIRDLMQLHVKGSRHHKLPTLFLFPHRVYKCIFLLARCLPNYYSSKHQAHTHTQPKI